MKKELYFLFAVLFLITIIVFLFTGCELYPEEDNETDDTQITTIDSGGEVGRFNSIAASGNGIYISYYDNTNNELKFAKSIDNGDTWDSDNIKVVDSDGNVGKYSSIAASGNNIYISYYNDTANDLKFARSLDNGVTWDSGNIRTIDSDGIVGEYSSIAVYGNYVHISYYDNTNNDLKYAKSTDYGATWDSGSIKVVDTDGDVGKYTSIAVYGSNIYIAYCDYSSGDLKFAKSIDNGVTWNSGNIKTVDSGGDVGYHNSLAINGSSVYISYYDYTNGNLKFAKSVDDGATWETDNIKTIDSEGNTGFFTSLAFNGSDIYISYYNITDKSIKFAKSVNAGDTWESDNIRTLDTEGDVGKYTSIAAVSGNVYISYFDNDNGDLKFIRL